MKSEKDFNVTSPVALTLNFHPADFAAVCSAAERSGMTLDAFCMLTIYQAANATIADVDFIPAPSTVLSSAYRKYSF